MRLLLLSALLSLPLVGVSGQDSTRVVSANDPLGALLDDMAAGVLADTTEAPAGHLDVGIERARPGGVVEQVSRNLERVVDALTIEGRTVTTAIFPALSYSSRSGFGFGLMPILNIDRGRLPKPASVSFSCIISTKKMFEIQLDADVALPGRMQLTAEAKMEKQPDELYAIGNGLHKSHIAEHEYHRQLVSAELVKSFGRRGHLIGGVSLDADHYTFSKQTSWGVDSVAALEILSQGAGWNGGAGAVFGVDTRDRPLAPHSGWHVRLIGMGYAVGHHFGLLTLDARRYWSLPLRSTLAAQVYVQHSWGDVPFVKKPTCGGTHLGRAIGHYLKYVDRTAWLGQVEWRVPIVWRLGLAAFGAAANVCHDRPGAFSHVHGMGGAGVRLAIFEKTGLNLRVDYARSGRGDQSFWFSIREAF